jgi:hypothetical protein
MPFPDAKKCFELRRRGREAHTLHVMRKFDDLARRQYAGPWHNAYYELGQRDWKERRPSNPMSEAIRAYVPHLIGEVRPKLTPGPNSSRSAATFREYRLNRTCTDIGFTAALEDAVVDAMFGVGILYFGRKAGASVFQIASDQIDAGEPFIQRVPLSAYFCDPNADRLSAASYMGHEYIADKDWVIELGIGNRDVLERIQRDTGTGEFDTMATQRGTRDNNEEDMIGEDIRLSDMCFTYQGQRFRCVIGPDDGPEEFVIEPYLEDGPDLGPYEFLELDRLPGAQMGVCPAAVIMDAHLASQGVFARMVRQLENTTRKIITDPSQDEFVMRLRDRNSDDEIIFGDGSRTKEVVYGGMIEEMARGYSVLDAVMQRMGPSTNLVGGKGDPGGSATGTSLLMSNAQVVLNLWKGRRDRFVSAGLNRVNWYLDVPMTGPMTIPTTLPSGRVVAITVDPNDPRVRDTSWQDFEYSVYPFSAPAMDPRMRQRSVTELVQVLPAFLQMVAGLNGDPAQAMATIASIYDWPELTQIIPTQDAGQLRQQLANYITQTQLGPTQSAKQAAQQVGFGSNTRLGQMRSDYAAGVPQA